MPFPVPEVTWKPLILAERVAVQVATRSGFVHGIAPDDIPGPCAVLVSVPRRRDWRRKGCFPGKECHHQSDGDSDDESGP